jgi:hypothetical protein
LAIGSLFSVANNSIDHIIFASKPTIVAAQAVSAPGALNHALTNNRDWLLNLQLMGRFPGCLMDVAVVEPRQPTIYPDSVVTPRRFGSPNLGGEGRIDWVGCYDHGFATYPPQ